MNEASNIGLIPNSQFLVPYTLHLADSNLILGHRNSEWCGHGPVLEQDIAITNISLDLIGQARNFYQYAATLVGNSATEDTLAYLRNAGEFRNCILCELPKGDWAFTITRQFFFSNYQDLLYKKLQESSDEQLAAIAAKALKEVTYHLRWSSEWVIRLGDGTEESYKRMTTAVRQIWPYVAEFFENADFEAIAVQQKTGVDVSTLQADWLKRTREIFKEATLELPAMGKNEFSGKSGTHTDHLEALLSEMQYLQRTYPNSEW